MTTDENLPQAIEPLVLFRSFLTVVSSLLVAQFLFMGILLALGYFVFTDYFEFTQLPSEEQAKVLESNQEADQPPMSLLVSLIVTTAVCYVGIGWMVFSVAPFGHFLHCAIVAGFIFVWMLQGYVAAPEDRKQIEMVYLFVFPASILLGGYLADRQTLTSDQEVVDDQ